MTSMVARLAAVAAGALALATGAAAADGFPGDDPVTPDPHPNLVVSAVSVTPLGDAQWQIHYTVKNRGTMPAIAFHVAVQENASRLLRETAYARLDAGASRSEDVVVGRAGCYIPVRFVADATHVVPESSEADNERWAIGLTNSACATQPRYAARAVSFHAVDESGTDWLGSDEPYWTFHAVGAQGTQRSRVSHVFGDVDTGETRSFGAAEGCLYLSCAGDPAPFGIGFSLELWEHDMGDVTTILTLTRLAFEAAGALYSQTDLTSWASVAYTRVAWGIKQIEEAVWGDDSVGALAYAYDPVQLAARLRAPGTAFDETRAFRDSSGTHYTITVAVARTG